jgi:hypothetical protein
MGKKDAFKASNQGWESEDNEPYDHTYSDRCLVLVKEPLPRKAQLIHAGVKHIRCISCGRIRPIAGAEELGDGWICEDCVPDVVKAR